MAFNFLTQELAIDLGTANTVIFQNGKIILGEPSIIAKEVKTDTVIAAEQMLSGFIKKATHRRKSIFSPSLKIVVGIPGGSTKVDMRSIRDSAEHSGAHELYLIYEPMASALGIGLDVLAPNGNMVVDIGGGTTEIAVITLGGIAESSSIHVAGNEITTDIIDYLGQQHSISIGRTTAENIKFAVGAVLSTLPEDQIPEPYIVRGKNIATGHPAEAFITYQEVAHCIDKTICKIENEIMKVLQKTPPELYSNIVENGIWLAGGGSLLRGIAQRFEEKVNIPFHIAEDPLKAVARGTCNALKHTDEYKFLMK